MCGIYGIARRTGPVFIDDLARRRDTLTHRGPDDSGAWISPCGRIGLAHRRLSIIDLSAAGHQPMAAGGGKTVITYNGEIYNFRELRDELARAGHAFGSHSDTEVLLAAYAQWGEECLQRFNGMFAFVIYDAGHDGKGPRLFLARDRVGKKPLYYAMSADRFEFASELKALDHARRVDFDALNFYLALGYVPGELCLAQGAAKLPPAHAARLDLDSFKLNTWRYWKLPDQDPADDIEALTEKAQSLILNAVRERMVSDVPLGVLLSGGLDSSLVTAAAAMQSSSPVKTFTIALPGSALDESGHARIVARHFGTEHHELPVGPAGLDVLDRFAPLVDEPLADSSLLPTYLVSALTREHVKVVLGGDGGDELFGGYDDYPNSLADARRLAGIPQGMLGFLARAAAMLPAGVKGRNRLASLREGPLQQMIWGSPYFDIELRRRLLSAEALDGLRLPVDAPEQWLLSLFDSGKGPVDRMTRTHFGSILPDDFLVKVDRASMAHGLEVRCPLLDYRLVEFAFMSIPDHWKVDGRETRRLQKRLARRWLPQELDVNRKQGFSIPLDAWLRAAGGPALEDRLRALPPFFRDSEMHGLVRGLTLGRANGSRLFALTMLAISSANLELR